MQRPALIGTLAFALFACSKQNDAATTPPSDTAATPATPATPADPPADPATDERAKQAKACDGGAADECTSVALMFQQGDGGKPDPAQARAYFDKGCTGGHAMACSYLADMLDKGEGGGADQAKARELWAAQCDAGNDADGECMKAATSFAISTAPADRTKAREIFAKLCSKDHHPACVGEAQLMLDIGSTKDAKHARTVLQKECDAGLGAACLALSLAMDQGKGGKKDAKAAAAMRQKACDNGVADVCAK
ncbi:MAG TPA: tetratricopeptide repeat protein [Nannocystaceae bacterium]|nr:tetratricopeptide repeat protein [Nannocystaceae bacterium]